MKKVGNTYLQVNSAGYLFAMTNVGFVPSVTQLKLVLNKGIKTEPVFMGE